jgi:hypothetical protein
MAKVIVDDERVAVKTTFDWRYLLLTGLVMGILYVGLAAAIQQYVIEPVYCQRVINVAICTNSQSVSGNIASIIVAVLSLVLLVRLRVFRPIVIIVASMVLLWGLSTWTAGLGIAEVLISSAILYALTFILVSWICRYVKTTPVLIVVALVVLTSRLTGIS